MGCWRRTEDMLRSQGKVGRGAPSDVVCRGVEG